MTIRNVCLLVLLILPLAGIAQAIAMTDLERIGIADVIVVGTIAKTNDIGKAEGQMQLIVNQVIKGAADHLITVNNLANFRHHMQLLNIGTQHIFFLQKMRDGYSIMHGLLCLRPMTELDNIVKLTADYPVTVSINKPITPLIFNGHSVINITVKNVTNTPISFSKIVLQGYFEAKEVSEPDITPYVGQEASGQNIDFDKEIILQPHQSRVLSLKYPVMTSEDWLAYFNMPNRATPTLSASEIVKRSTSGLEIRVKVCVDLETPRRRIFDVYYVCSPLCHTTIHYDEKDLQATLEPASPH